MKYQKIVLAGGGTLGSQIAYQSAYCGYDVTIWLRGEEDAADTRKKLAGLSKIYEQTLAVMNTPQGKNPSVWCCGLAAPAAFDYEACVKANEAAPGKITIEFDLAKAVEDADLVIEAIIENVQAKTELYRNMAPVLPEKTVVVTNSSSLLPSMFAESTGRPEKFMALHFANKIWQGNTAEVMNHAGTNMEYYNDVVEFAKSINMVPLCLYKEQPGYLLNSMLIPFLDSALELWANEVADYKTIDMTWKLSTNSHYGPFEILDVVGIDTAVAIYSQSPKSKDPNTTQGKMFARLKEMLAAGKRGVATGEGFYKYS